MQGKRNEKRKPKGSLKIVIPKSLVFWACPMCQNYFSAKVGGGKIGGSCVRWFWVRIGNVSPPIKWCSTSPESMPHHFTIMRKKYDYQAQSTVLRTPPLLMFEDDDYIESRRWLEISCSFYSILVLCDVLNKMFSSIPIRHKVSDMSILNPQSFPSFQDRPASQSSNPSGMKLKSLRVCGVSLPSLTIR